MIVEPLIFSKIKGNEDNERLRKDSEFMEKLKVLLIVYLNMGVTQIRLNNHKYAKVVLEHGWKMARKLMGEGSYFEQKFFRKLNTQFETKKKRSHHLKSTHISYIEEDANMIDAKQKHSYKPISTFVEKEIKEEDKYSKNRSRGSTYKNYRTQKLSKEASEVPSSAKVINKSNRKIFVSVSVLVGFRAFKGIVYDLL